MAVRVLGLASAATGLEDHRHAIAALITPAGSMQARGGLFPGGGGALTSVSAMQASISPFYAWVDGGGALEAGYDFCLDSATTLTFPDGEPGVARIDQVIARVLNNPYDASGETLGDVFVLKGQSSGAKAALPPSCEVLWEVTVPAGASAGTGGINFSTAAVDKRRKTVTAGGVLPIGNAAERDAIAAPYDGMAIWRIDRDWLEVYDGAKWRVFTVGSVSSVADRAAVTNPYNGQIIYRTDFGLHERYDGAKWRTVELAVVGNLSDLTGTLWVTDPFAGQLAIVRNENNMLYRYTGTAWVRNERGLVWSGKSLPNVNNVGTTATDIIFGSFTPPVAGCYRIVGRIPFDVSAVGTDAKSSLLVGASEVDYQILPGPGGVFIGALKCDGPWDFTTTASQTVKMTILKGAGTATLNSRLVDARIDIYYAGPLGIKA